jgi:hypothetical protein
MSLDIPTWTPDWRDEEFGTQGGLDENFDYLSLNIAAAGDSITEFQDPDLCGILQVHGYPITKIEAVLDRSTGVCGIQEISRVWQGDTDTLKGLLIQANSEDSKTWERLDMSKHSHRVCRTTGGFIGTVPRCAKPGDEVWILLGGRLPFILRSGYDPQRQRIFNADYLRDRVCEVVGPGFFPGCLGGKLYNICREGHSEGNHGQIPNIQKLSLV